MSLEKIREPQSSRLDDKTRIIQDIPDHYFPRFALTDLGLLVRETLDKRAKRNANEDTETEPQPRSADQADSTRTAGVDGPATSSADGHRADPAAPGQ